MVSRVYWIFLLAAFVSLVAALPRPSNINKGRSRECGVHISAKRVKDAATRFRTFRLAPDSENATATLDIHFHVVYANTTFEGGYVPDKQIYDQVDVLNRDYNATGIKWQLRSISRIESKDWFLGTAPDSRQETAMKQLYRNGTKAALNVYTVGFQNPDAAGLLGIATFPMDYSSAPQSDGIMLLYSTLPGSAATTFNLGRTLVHEAGHWCGLYHTFQGGCDAPGDEVDDTPPEASPSKGCPVNRKTCPGTPGMDPVRNFMDYSDDACMDSFTRGQASRMRSHLRAYRGVDFK
jgi:hypothetical protein